MDLSSQSQTSVKITDKIISTTLDNGIRIFMIPSRRSASVSVQAWVKTGSIHEEEFLGCGLSHFLEHMVFTGTKSFPGSTEISDRVTKLGGNLNACTGNNCTMYYINVPAHAFREAASMVTEMVTEPLFPEDCFQREKNVILRECSMYNDSASNVLWHKFLDCSCKNHPVRLPIIGFEEKIKTVDRDMMCRYFRKRYTPNRIVFVVAGDVDCHEVIDFIREKTSAVPIGNLLDPVLLPEPEQTDARRIDFTFNDPAASLIAGWKVPGCNHADLPALHLYRSILGGSDSSRLNRILTIEKELVLSCSADYFGLSEFGFLLTEARMKPENAEKTLEEVQHIIRDLSRDPIRTPELRRAVSDQKMIQLLSVRNCMHLARTVGRAVMDTDGIECLDHYLDRLQKVTAEEIEDAVKRYLTENAMTAAVLYPENWKGFAGKKTVRQAEAVVEPVAKTLPEGQKFVFLEDHSLPLVHAVLLFPGSSTVEGMEYAGITELLSDCLFTGAGPWDEETLNELLDNESISLYAQKMGNCLAFILSCMKENLPTAVRVLKTVLAEPAFPDKPFKREQEANLQEMEEAANDPRSLSVMRVTEMMYQKHPCGATLEQKIDIVKNLTPKALKDFYFNKVLIPGKTCFAFAGDLDMQDALDIAQDFCKTVPWSQTPLKDSVPMQFASGDKLQIFNLKKEQAVVSYAFPGITQDSPDRYAMALIEQAYGAGMSSRLFRSIREERGLAYYAGMTQRYTPGNGLIICYAGTQAETAEQVVEIFEEERIKMVNGGLTQEEFDAAKNAVLFRLEDAKLDTISLLKTAAFNEFAGIGCMETAHKIRKIRELSLATVNRTVAKIFNTSSKAIAVVTPQKK